ncbi:putative polysaccharide biosynthesis protein [Candidatus Clostridium radicumherbarum]|uniref:Oligosaccharide flippase family protein n=1 Tax=Candidatus Clostridium radicumherbarum TaxID=3381662 RepID=A0ABW8TW66_9CLOT
MRKQSLLRGTIILAIAGILAKFMGVFFRWPLIMLIGDEGIGYYQMSYPLYTFFIAMASGIPIAISKLVAERNAASDKIGSFQVLRNALYLMFILGGGFTAFLLIFSKNLIIFFKWDYKAYYSLLGIAFAPFIISIMSCFRGFFQGMQNMYPTAISQVLESLGRVCVGIGLAYILLPKGIHISAGGAAFGAAAGGILALFYLFIKFTKVRKEFGLKKIKRNKEILGMLLYIAVPISLGAAASSIMGLIDSFLVPQKLLQAGFDYAAAAALYGQLTGKAMVLVSVPLTLSMALCTSLVPVIAEAHLLGRTHEVLQKMDMALRISAVIAIPSLLGLYFMSGPILGLIFPGHSDGYKILKLLSVTIPFIVLSQSCTSVLQGIGKYIQPVINLGLGCLVKVIISYMLVSKPEINIYGAAIGSIAGYATAAILNFNLLKKVLNIKINYYDILIKPAAASIIMIIFVVFIYMNVYNYTVRNSITTVIAVAAGAIIYIFLILIFGVFKYSYIKKRLFK